MTTNRPGDVAFSEICADCKTEPANLGKTLVDCCTIQRANVRHSLNTSDMDSPHRVEALYTVEHGRREVVCCSYSSEERHHDRRATGEFL
jgi:hypothetical protein